MRRLLRLILWVAILVAAAVLAYGWLGYRDAVAEAPELSKRADALIAADRGGVALGVERRAMLLAVEDPAFGSHYGIDFTTPGAGATTITQSLAKAEGFADFSPALRKIRQSGYAVGLERALTKPQILALFLDGVPMGRGPEGAWIDGLYAASEAHFGAAPDAVARADFLALIAVMIAPATLDLGEPGPALADRLARIERLLEGDCVPAGHSDVWLEGCAGP